QLLHQAHRLFDGELLLAFEAGEGTCPLLCDLLRHCFVFRLLVTSVSVRRFRATSAPEPQLVDSVDGRLLARGPERHAEPFQTTSTPMLRAVPAIERAAASTSEAFMSSSLVCAISRT